MVAKYSPLMFFAFTIGALALPSGAQEQRRVPYPPPEAVTDGPKCVPPTPGAVIACTRRSYFDRCLKNETALDASFCRGLAPYCANFCSPHSGSGENINYDKKNIERVACPDADELGSLLEQANRQLTVSRTVWSEDGPLLPGEYGSNFTFKIQPISGYQCKFVTSHYNVARIGSIFCDADVPYETISVEVKRAESCIIKKAGWKRVVGGTIYEKSGAWIRVRTNLSKLFIIITQKGVD